MIVRRLDRRNGEMGAYLVEGDPVVDTRVQSQRNSWQESDEMVECCLPSMEAH